MQAEEVVAVAVTVAVDVDVDVEVAVAAIALEAAVEEAIAAVHSNSSACSSNQTSLQSQTGDAQVLVT